MSTAKRRRGAGKVKGVDGPNGDPALIDRIKRALGAYQLRTGETITAKELGALVGLTPSSMTDVMNADRKVTIAEASAWSKKLGVEFKWLAIGEGPMIQMSAEDAARFGAPPLTGEAAADFFARRRSEAQQSKRPGSKGR
jgi:hypothetical protein